MDGLVVHSEYDVNDELTVKVTVPKIWLRTNAPAGSRLALAEHPETHQLIIDRIAPQKRVS